MQPHWEDMGELVSRIVLGAGAMAGFRKAAGDVLEQGGVNPRLDRVLCAAMPPRVANCLVRGCWTWMGLLGRWHVRDRHGDLRNMVLPNFPSTEWVRCVAGKRLQD